MSFLLFLDTNVFLSFFHFADDDLESLRQLTKLVKDQDVVLLLPDQVRQEFDRNRDGKVLEAVKALEDAKLPTGYPRLCHHYDEYEALRPLVEEHDRLRRELLAKVRADAPAHDFPADKTTRELFRVATRIEITDALLQQAERRHRRGNPPGKPEKRESYGDAINWEALLSIGEKGDLHMVAQDSDWASPLDRSQFNAFLADEWRRKRGGEVHFYLRLQGFLERHLPDIKLRSQTDALIEELALTRSFQQTHRLIAQLEGVLTFSDQQLNAIVEAYITNDQLYRIVADPDVKEFLLKVLLGRVYKVRPDLIEKLVALIEYHAPSDDDLRLIGEEAELSGILIPKLTSH